MLRWIVSGAVLRLNWATLAVRTNHALQKTLQKNAPKNVMETRKMRGQDSEPVPISAGIAAREAARAAEAEQWAHRRIKALRLFYNHLTVYAIVNFILLLIDVSTPGSPWFYQVLLGWGLFVGLHAAHTYELLPWTNRDWERRKVQELIEERRRNTQFRG